VSLLGGRRAPHATSDGPGLQEAPAWAVWGVAAAGVWVTYACLPADGLSNASGTGPAVSSRPPAATGSRLRPSPSAQADAGDDRPSAHRRLPRTHRDLRPGRGRRRLLDRAAPEAGDGRARAPVRP